MKKGNKPHVIIPSWLGDDDWDGVDPRGLLRTEDYDCYKQWLADSDAGRPVADIADVLRIIAERRGQSIDTVRRLLGAKTERRPPNVKPDHAVLDRMIDEGKTDGEISITLGISERTSWDRRRDRGLTRDKHKRLTGYDQVTTTEVEAVTHVNARTVKGWLAEGILLGEQSGADNIWVIHPVEIAVVLLAIRLREQNATTFKKAILSARADPSAVEALMPEVRAALKERENRGRGPSLWD